MSERMSFSFYIQQDTPPTVILIIGHSTAEILIMIAQKVLINFL